MAAVNENGGGLDVEKNAGGGRTMFTYTAEGETS